MKNIEEKIQALIESQIQDLGYELYDVEYNKKGKDYYLTLYIDNENGISLEDCEKVTNGINDILDEADYIKEQYFLEVSSPGLERVLKKEKHFLDNLNKEIEVNLYTKVNNSKKHQGILKEYSEKHLIILTEDIEIVLEKNNIAQVKLIYNWN